MKIQYFDFSTYREQWCSLTRSFSDIAEIEDQKIETDTKGRIRSKTSSKLDLTDVGANSRRDGEIIWVFEKTAMHRAQMSKKPNQTEARRGEAIPLASTTTQAPSSISSHSSSLDPSKKTSNERIADSLFCNRYIN